MNAQIKDIIILRIIESDLRLSAFWSVARRFSGLWPRKLKNLSVNDQKHNIFTVIRQMTKPSNASLRYPSY